MFVCVYYIIAATYLPTRVLRISTRRGVQSFSISVVFIFWCLNSSKFFDSSTLSLFELKQTRISATWCWSVRPLVMFSPYLVNSLVNEAAMDNMKGCEMAWKPDGHAVRPKSIKWQKEIPKIKIFVDLVLSVQATHSHRSPDNRFLRFTAVILNAGLLVRSECDTKYGIKTYNK